MKFTYQSIFGGQKTDILHTLAMLGFSNGGLPSGPSTDGLLMFKMHFLSS